MKSENERLLSLAKEQSEEKEESENTELRQQLELNEGGITSIKEELRYNSEHAAKEDDGVG